MSAPTAPFVVARRWDQLGSRLGAIVNARVLSDLLDLDFRFIWPRGADAAINNPDQLFDEAFLNRYEIQPAELDARRCVDYYELIALAPADRQAVLSPGSGAFIDMNELFGVVSADDDDGDTPQRRYHQCFDGLGWNEQMRRLIDVTADADEFRGLAGVHVRAGDIVTGAWRHSIAHAKYEPAPFVRQTLSVLTGEGRRVLVLSDSAEYLAHLRDRFVTILTSQQLLQGYERLTEAQRALADIVALSQCDPIVGPPASAFSKLAANVGGVTLARADTLGRQGEERAVLLAGLAEDRSLAARSEFWRKLTARDICWFLDVFGETLSVAEQHALAREATSLDPDFCGALSRLGRAAALAGDGRAARKATRRAVRTAEHVERHNDPLFEALVSDVVARCLTPAGHRRASALAVAERDYERCEELLLFWFGRERILPKLAFLIDVARTVSEQPYLVRRRAARALRRAGGGRLQLTSPHPEGLAQHRAEIVFDPLARDLERIAQHIHRAFGGLGLDLELPSPSASGDDMLVA